MPPPRPPFLDVYETTFAAVWRYAAGHGVKGGDLEDIVQEVYVVVHRRLADFEGRSSITTWVVGIAVNVVRAFRRRRATRDLGEPLEHFPEPLDHRTPADQVSIQEDVGFLVDLLERLTDNQREAFVLSELNELSAIEGAELLGINENTFRTRLRGARRKVSEAVAARKRRP